jgi:hypothetical protein
MHPILETLYCDEDGAPELFNASICRVLLLIKFRPGVRRFIRSLVSQNAVIHVYTKGARPYMQAVLSVLDPDGTLIRGFRWSREDDVPFPTDRKFANRIVVESNKSLLILDDSPHVWDLAHISASSVFLLPVDRYDFAERIFINSVSPVFPPDLDLFFHSQVWRKIADLMPLSAASPSTPSDGGSPVGRLMQRLASLFFQSSSF